MIYYSGKKLNKKKKKRHRTISMDEYEGTLGNKNIEHSLKLIESHDRNVEKVQVDRRYNKLIFDTNL